MSAVVFDYTGGFANSKLDPLFKEAMGDRIEQRIVKREKIPVNPFAKHDIQIDDDIFVPEENADVADKIAEIFRSVYSLGDQQRSAVYSAVLNGLKLYGDKMSFPAMVDELEKIGNNYAKTVISKIQTFTASFAQMISDKLYSPDESVGNSFIMTIAGYGTGKSHLAVCLGALFSGDTSLAESITDHIGSADTAIGEHIRKINKRPNIIIALNGMNNFNLDAEVLKTARQFLIRNGSSDKVLRSITKSYDVARHFVEKNYDLHKDSFVAAANKHGVNFSTSELKAFLLDHVEDDKEAIEAINEVYKEITGDAIHWDRGISAGDIVSILQKELCGINKPFNKVLILFDEFGRYIEYAAANPTIAGEASLQQIFEAVQDANGRVIFTGFIQNDLSAYLSRIDKTANIIRYVGRYENSEKYYLSSNFETILASLLKKDEMAGFSKIVGNALDRYDSFHKKVFSALRSWDKASQKKGVWISYDTYKSVILTGCYPIHPITVWLLSNTSKWMQQRSTIAFAEEMVNSIKQVEIGGAWLPYVYPIDIVDSNIYNEMLNSEEKGLVQSQFCMLYRDINLKIGNKLTDDEEKVLKAILVINICRFSFKGREDALLAIRYCSNLKEEVIQARLAWPISDQRKPLPGTTRDDTIT